MKILKEGLCGSNDLLLKNMLYYLYNGDELLGFIYNGNTYYYHKNIFGDILGILNSTYKEIVTYEYDSWGAISNIIDISGINLGTINPFRYIKLRQMKGISLKK